jgi:site-specific DNA recombinase
VLDTLNLIELMKKHKVVFHSITDNIDTTTAMGKFFLNIMPSLAQMERDLISERTKDALSHKISRNERAGQIPYGWTLAKDVKTLVMNVEEKKAIRLIRELHGKGLDYLAICGELTKHGYQPLGAIGTLRALRTSSRGQHGEEKFKAPSRA